MNGVQRGFSLVEVLISILVLALGVIGAGGMQLTALRTTQQSSFQTIAMQLASEMADKMRSNNGQMKLKEGENPFLGLSYNSAIDEEPGLPGKLCYADYCSSGELAEFDIYEWKKKVKTTLPGGRVVVCRDSTPWSEGEKSLIWGCNSGSGNGAVVIKLGWHEKNPDGTLIKGPAKQFPPSVAIAVEPYTP